MSKWKLPRIEKAFVSMAKVDYIKLEKWSKFLMKKKNLRSFIISETLLQREALVYNGKEFIPVFVTKNMINHRFGEFSIPKVMGKAVVMRKLERLRKKNKLLKKKK